MIAEPSRSLSDRVDDAVRSIGRFARAAVIESHRSGRCAPWWETALVRVTCTIVGYDAEKREHVEHERDIYVVSSLYWPTGGYRMARIHTGGWPGSVDAARSYLDIVAYIEREVIE